MAELNKAPKQKKKHNAAAVQQELRDLGKPAAGQERPPLDLKKLGSRAAMIVAALWVLAIGTWSWQHTLWPIYVAGVLTAAVAGAGYWFVRYIRKNEQLAGIVRGADTADGRKDALKHLETHFKKGDVSAKMARAQIEMQEDPRRALETLETIDLNKITLAPMADQVRAIRAQLHLSLGEVSAARALADKLELGKQEDQKTRVMFATVAGEAWARTGAAKKAVETLELFNPEDPENAEARVQMWRARAFAYAATNDTKAVDRALKKLSDANPHLLAMFIGQKKIHPLLERAAKQLLMRSGAVPRKMVRQKL
ncbi:hypothetical protein BH09MYX1_BH09MYX1_43870 [soil metagenome]